ncbi:MAG: Rab family protein, partial [Erysipelotrichaceae bacterium]
MLIKDEKLSLAIHSQLNIKEMDEIKEEDMLSLTSLNARKQGIFDISGLELATNLEYLDLTGNNIHDITALTNLTKLRNINLSKNQLEDLKPFTNLIKLERLDISFNS